MNTATGKTVTVEYFALLREVRGCAREQRSTAANTPRELYREVRALFPFPLSDDVLRVAVNGAFTPWDCPLNNNDTVVFIPPVAGG